MLTTYLRWRFFRTLPKKKQPKPRRRAAVQPRLEALEDRCLPNGAPAATIYVGDKSYDIATVVNDPGQVLFMGGQAKGQDWGQVPQKTITFTNNAGDKSTIYPFLYSPNTEQLYDPIDTNNEEYRLYVGYNDNGKETLGLPYGKSITITVPLVFWNGARAAVATDGTNLIPEPAQVGTLNPFQFYYSKNGKDAGIFIGTQGVVSSSDGNGILMYYHSYDNNAPNDPNPAAPGQLIEWTIRDQEFLNKVNAYDQANHIGTIAASELTTLINYDVSYVDDLLAPVAMEATQVPIPIQYIQSGTATVNSNGHTTTTIQLQNDVTRAFLLQLLTTKPDQAPAMPVWHVLYNKSQTETIDVGAVTDVNTNTGVVKVEKDGTVEGLPAGLAAFVFYTDDVKQDYGWTGAENSITQLQQVVKDFTGKADASGLGQYFGGKGWPQYYNPVSQQVKIPGGANILANSPLTNKRSPYDQLYNLLTSNGAIRIQYFTNGVLKPPDQNLTAGSTVTFELTLSDAFTAADLQAMRDALANQNVAWNVFFNQNPIGVIQAIDTATRIVTVKLSQTIENRPAGYSLDFRAPVADPYATKLRDLWYSWANYYVNLAKFKTFGPVDISARVSADTDSPADTRVLTFATAQTQLALGMKVTGQGIAGLITIEKISEDRKTVYLSAPVPQGLKDQTVTFTFSKPEAINTYNDPNVNLSLVNANGFGTDKKFADAFAASVYETMAVYSTIQNPTIPELPRSMGLVFECIGGGVGHLPTSVFVNISADVRDLGKSVLRGVPDFNKYPNTNTTDAQWKPGAWYPPPSRPTDGANYNVFNLDPYVWFVHQRLGLSGYGFSFDDDASDIGAKGTSTLAVNYAGLAGLNNPFEWFMSTPWGVVKTTNANVALYSGPDRSLQGKTIVSLVKNWQGIIVYNQVRPDDPANAALGAYLDGTGFVSNPAANSFTRIGQLLNLNELTFVITQAPWRKMPFTTDITFSGFPPKKSDPLAAAFHPVFGGGSSLLH